MFTPEDQDNSAVNANDPVTSIHNVMHGDYARLAADQKQTGVMDSYLNSKTGLKLEVIEFEGSSILCDTSTGKARPILPSLWTRPMFDTIHGLSHPGPKPTQQATTQRFVWHGMKKDIRQ